MMLNFSYMPPIYRTITSVLPKQQFRKIWGLGWQPYCRARALTFFMSSFFKQEKSTSRTSRKLPAYWMRWRLQKEEREPERWEPEKTRLLNHIRNLKLWGNCWSRQKRDGSKLFNLERRRYPWRRSSLRWLDRHPRMRALAYRTWWIQSPRRQKW